MRKQNIIQELQNLLFSCNLTYKSFQEKEMDEHDFLLCHIDWFIMIGQDIIDYLKTHRCYKK